MVGYIKFFKHPLFEFGEELENLFTEKVDNYLIRRCTKEDLKSVISINLNCLPEHYSDFFFEDLLRTSPESFYVAEKKDIIVGYIMCRVEYGFSNFKRFNLTRKGHIVYLAILEKHRRQGLGENLVKLAAEGLRTKGCTEIYLEVRMTNNEAVLLYKQLNYEILSKMNGYYRDNESAYLMAKRII
jgi:ribosomal-protein-alanine N-acetyltransferase